MEQVLRDFLARRITDGVIRRMIHPWLKAGGWITVFASTRKPVFHEAVSYRRDCPIDSGTLCGICG